MKRAHPPLAAQVSHGTLGVALACGSFMVVATDSRRTYRSGSFEDDTKKLFLLPDNRVVTIAGLVDAFISGIPGLTAQIPALLDLAIDRCSQLNDPYWEDPPPPPDLPEEFKRFWGADPYPWWNLIAGDIQTILNIAATYAAQEQLYRYDLSAIVAGHKANGQAKLERLRMQPQYGVSAWGRSYIGVSRVTERATSDRGIMWATVGITRLADDILAGSIDRTVAVELNGYGGIRSFLERRQTGTDADMTEPEMIALAHDLIRATAERYPTVGCDPLQTAILRPGRAVNYDQPIVTAGAISLPLDGTWHLGVVFTPDYPFSSQARGAVFTFCEVVGNRSPIPLGGNFFYGSEFRDALFSYDAGELWFGDNNRLTGCELVLASGVDESRLQCIMPLFARVTRP